MQTRGWRCIPALPWPHRTLLSRFRDTNPRIYSHEYSLACRLPCYFLSNYFREYIAIKKITSTKISAASRTSRGRQKTCMPFDGSTGTEKNREKTGTVYFFLCVLCV